MPTICLRCKKQLEAVPGQAPRCPECGGTRFSFVSARKAEQLLKEQSDPEPPADIRSIEEESLPAKQEEPISLEPTAPEEPMSAESIESIRIREPGMYDLNLLKLAESDERVILIGKDGNYRLDLSSMMRSKKKR